MNSWQETISRTGFFTSIVSYAAFWFLDLARPGFVARYLSVHIFLLASIVFGIAWTLCVRQYRDWPFPQYVVAGLFGILGAWAAWEFGGGFESYRLLVVAAAAITPAVVLSVVRSV